MFVAAIFWLGPALVLYAYVGFPLLLSCLVRGRRYSAGGRSVTEPETTITVIIPAYNEERSIEARIVNVLGSSYPQRLLDVIVVSDASTDRTNEIASHFASTGVRLLVQPERRGKTNGLNLAMKVARGGIAVFTDANALFPPQAISTLVGYFDDPHVGLVSGYTRYVVTEAGDVSDATGAYTRLERTIKRAESRWGSCVGADGAIFAMRRTLYRPLRDDDINDFVLPLSVIEQGFPCLLAEDVFCSEHPGTNLESEFRRQSRITNRSLRAIWRRRHLLNPLRHPAFSFFLFSHKVSRFVAPVLLCVSVAALLWLLPRGGLYTPLAAVTVAAALVVAVARIWPAPALFPRVVGRALQFVNVFVTMNVAILHGWWKFLTGHAEISWQHDRALSR
jgi:cellulose synthase/poly-beta-1,6-N-acetylglucosamine synthase-like glycosyltransferase